MKAKGKEARIYPVRMPDSPLHVGTLCRYQYQYHCAYFLMLRGLTDHFDSRMSIYLYRTQLFPLRHSVHGEQRVTSLVLRLSQNLCPPFLTSFSPLSASSAVKFLLPSWIFNGRFDSPQRADQQWTTLDR